MQFLRVRIQNAASDRSIPPKLPIFTGQPKWHRDRSILNAKTKNEFVFRFSYFTFENEFVFRFSFANLKTKNEKEIRYLFFVRKFENEKGKNGIYTDPSPQSAPVARSLAIYRDILTGPIALLSCRQIGQTLHKRSIPS